MKRNKLTNWVLTTVMLTTLFAPVTTVEASASTISTTAGQKPIHLIDLQNVTPYQRDRILHAVDLGLIHGDDSGHFRPADQLTRQEMAVLLTQALQLPIQNRSTSFSDVDPNGWSSRYIEAVRAAGLMQGDGTAHFHPTHLISRQEMAVVLMRAAHQSLDDKSGTSLPTNDWKTIGQWAQPYVRTALELGAMDSSSNTFAPTDAVRRVDVAKMMIETFFPQEHPALLQQITGDKVQINGVNYQVSKGLQGILQESNSQILAGAKVKFDSTGRTIDRITSLQLQASGTKAGDGEAEFSRNLVLDGHGTTLDGDLVAAADYLSVTNLIVAGNFRIGKELQNDFHASGLTVKGNTTIDGGDENTVVFADSQLQSVDVNKQNVHVVSQGTTSVQSMTVNVNASIDSSSTSSVKEVTLADGAQQVALNGSLQQVYVNGSNPLTVTGSVNITNLAVNGSSNLTLNSTGTVGELQVNNPGAKVTVSSSTRIAQLSLASGVSSASISGAGAPDPAPVTPPAAPIPLKPFTNQLLTLGNGSITIDIKDYYTIDPNSHLTYNVTSPADASIIAVSVTSHGVLTITPKGAGTVLLKIAIADDNNGSVKLKPSFSVTVNTPPASNVFPSQTKPLGTGDVVLKLGDYFSDADHDAMTYDATIDDSTIAGKNLDNVTGTLTLTPTKIGSTTVHVIASDGHGGTHSESFTLTVPNQNPVKQRDLAS
ncbi:MAG: S-layer homology domain-containing protein, partial [Tumebacillaceae bacterium]